MWAAPSYTIGTYLGCPVAKTTFYQNSGTIGSLAQIFERLPITNTVAYRIANGPGQTMRAHSQSRSGPFALQVVRPHLWHRGWSNLWIKKLNHAIPKWAILVGPVGRAYPDSNYGLFLIGLGAFCNAIQRWLMFQLGVPLIIGGLQL